MPLYYKKCATGNGNGGEESVSYDADLDSYVKHLCPRPCGMWDEWCWQQTLGNGGSIYGSAPERWPEYLDLVMGGGNAGNATSASAGIKDSMPSTLVEFHARRNKFEVHMSGGGHYWWGWDPSKYERQEVAVEHCYHKWDHELQTHDPTTCSCWARELVKAKNPADRHEWDWPNHMYGVETHEEWTARRNTDYPLTREAA